MNCEFVNPVNLSTGQQEDWEFSGLNCVKDNFTAGELVISFFLFIIFLFLIFKFIKNDLK